MQHPSLATTELCPPVKSSFGSFWQCGSGDQYVSRVNKYLVFCLAAMGLLVTGCPRNQYIVELTPRGKVVERKLTFYREDGTDTNGVPHYQRFPQDELAAIRKLYPP